MSQKNKPKAQADESRLIVKVIGAPGTGKTTNVVGNPELKKDGLFVDHLENYDLNDQLLVTYTKGAVEEAKDRLKEMTGIPKKDLDSQIRTIHSHAYQKMGVGNGDLVHYGFKKDFCDKQGIEFDNEDTTEDLMSTSSDTSDGDMLFRISGWLKAYRLSVNDWRQCPVTYPGKDNVEHLLEEWEDYKSIHGKIEFPDMIEGVVDQCVSVLREGEYGDSDIDNDREYLRSCMDDENLSPKAVRNHPAFIDEPVFYVDEAQDLTFLQWDWFLCQKLAAEKVFLAADDDQSIYSWAGAEPEDQILAEEAETRVLEKTYRIPDEVWTACKSCIEQVDERLEKNIESTGNGGEFISLGAKDANAYVLQEHLIESDDVMILFRAKYHILEFSKQLNDVGIPYKHESLPFQTWSNDLVKVRDILATLCNDELIVADDLGVLIEHIPDRFIDAKQPGMVKYLLDEPEYSINGVLEYFTFGMNEPTEKQFAMWYAKGASGWDEQEFNGYQGDALYANIRNERFDLQPQNVRIMTIHKSKGQEADTVILGTDSTNTIMANMSEDETDHRPVWMQQTIINDAERRVVYVGMSRAQRKLIMGEGFVTPDTCLKISSLLGGDKQ